VTTGERRRRDSASGYRWDDEIPAAIGVEDASEQTTTTTTTDPQDARGDEATPSSGKPPSERWVTRQFEVASRVASLEEAVGRGARAHAARSRASAHLRRLTGAFGAVRDSLYEVTRVTEKHPGPLAGPVQPYVSYVECVYWWFSHLLDELSKVAATDAPLVPVVEFSAEYAVARILPLYEAFADADPPRGFEALRAACVALHEDVVWLEWHLKER
jgi:hypothetical protein